MKPVLAVVAALAVGTAIPVFGSDYALSFTVQLLVFVALAYSWNLIGGYAGYTHFGQVSFFGLGAYVGALALVEIDHGAIVHLVDMIAR